MKKSTSHKVSWAYSQVSGYRIDLFGSKPMSSAQLLWARMHRIGLLGIFLENLILCKQLFACGGVLKCQDLFTFDQLLFSPAQGLEVVPYWLKGHRLRLQVCQYAVLSAKETMICQIASSLLWTSSPLERMICCNNHHKSKDLVV